VNPSFRLGRLFGIEIGFNWSLVFIFALVTWTLATNVLPVDAPGYAPLLYWFTAAVGAVLFYVCLLAHELSHSLVARSHGVKVTGITLWLFGGVSQLEGEPSSARSEALIAGVGPLTSFGVAAVAVGLAFATQGNPLVSDLFAYLTYVNVALGLFNLVPAFPLDGGKIAHAAIWWRTGDRNRATKATGRTGQGFALVVGLFGLWGLAAGSSGGLLALVLAFFLYQSASMAVAQGSIGRRIESLTVADVMDREPVTIPSTLTLLQAHEEFFARYRWQWFAVVDPAMHFLGLVRGQRVDAEISAGRPALAVADVLEDDEPVRIKEEEPLRSLLGAEGLPRLGAMVAVDDEGVLKGVVTLAEVRRALRLAT
jgi:Zn-dependent protease